MSHSRAVATAVGVAAALCVSTVSVLPAQAQGGGRDVRSAGSCTGGGVWHLKAKADDGQLEIEFEVDTNRVGQVWSVRIADGAHLVTSRTATTRAPSGSFEVSTRTANRAGVDVIHASATRGAGRCSGSVRF